MVKGVKAESFGNVSQNLKPYHLHSVKTIRKRRRAEMKKNRKSLLISDSLNDFRGLQAAPVALMLIPQN